MYAADYNMRQMRNGVWKDSLEIQYSEQVHRNDEILKLPVCLHCDTKYALNFALLVIFRYSRQI